MTPTLFAPSTFNPATLFNPMALWTDLAMKTTEMLFASGQVIGNRVDQMARAGANPSARDRKEFALMGSEKMRAATESGMAIATRLQTANMQLARKAWDQWIAALTVMATLGHAGLGPVHRTATANARRLTKARRTARTRTKGA